jgi:hypothetical protein
MKSLAVVACALLVLAGCSVSAEEVPERPVARLRHRVETPADRDLAAVRAALGRVDFCAALAAGKVRALDATGGPFACSGALGSGRVDAGVRVFDTETRLRTPAQVVGGAKAYVTEEAGACTVDLPVSFGLAITVSGLSASCRELLAVAAAFVAGAPAGAPQRDACGALLASYRALGERADDLADVADRAGGSCLRGRAERLDLRNWLPRALRADDTVAGIPVTVSGGQSCSVTWRLSARPLPHAVDTVPVATVTADGCPRAKELAGAAVAVFRARADLVAPQDPLVYRADEPDSPARGACAFVQVGRGSDCEPHAEVAVPGGRDAVVRAQGTDPNVDCAVARDAVAAHFGQREAVAMTFNGLGTCRFVTADRLVEVEVDVRPESLASVEPMSPDAGDVTIGGHPGILLPDSPTGRHTIQIALGGEDDAGTLYVALHAGPVGPAPGIAKADLDKVELVVADVLAAHFR